MKLRKILLFSHDVRGNVFGDKDLLFLPPLNAHIHAAF